MLYPKCNSDSIVIDSRLLKEGNYTRRRRECLNPKCVIRFTTRESLVEENLSSEVDHLNATVSHMTRLALATFIGADKQIIQSLAFLAGSSARQVARDCGYHEGYLYKSPFTRQPDPLTIKQMRDRLTQVVLDKVKQQEEGS